MRSISHWTPHYIVSRINEKLYRKNNPGKPWLTPQAIGIVEDYLQHGDLGLEFGSGRSTLWFSKHVHYLVSVEHHQGWYENVKEMLADGKCDNVDYRFISLDGVEESEGQKKYADLISRFDDNYFDFVLVDGAHRDICALSSLSKIRPGGLLIIDNVNWFLPCASTMPKSRSEAEGPLNDIWSQVYQQIKSWRKIWTSSGVTDTAFYFKPLN